MSVQEMSMSVNWNILIPIAIAGISLLLTMYQLYKNAGRESITDTERKIDRALVALKECEVNLQQCGHEKDELRREKFALLEQIARLARASTPGNG